MTDIVDSATRSRMMSGIRGKNTKPEMLIRSQLHRRGFRFRLHRKDLPGKPDIVLPKFGAAIFVHGCFGMAMSVRYLNGQKRERNFGERRSTETGSEISPQEICCLRVVGGSRLFGSVQYGLAVKTLTLY